LSEIIDSPFTLEVSQNSKGYYQIRAKIKTDTEPDPKELVALIDKTKKALEAKKCKVQPIEVRRK
jgi:hypothetical protein